MDHPYPWLKYANAGDVSSADVDFDGIAVESPTGEKLGSVDGFIVDSGSSRPYYVVVDAGGWFKSKHFLLPIGHVKLNADTDRDALVADIARDRIDNFPGFDKDEFDTLTPDAVRSMNDEICSACSVSAVNYSATEPFNKAWERDDYRYPDWWQAEPSLPDRMGDAAFSEQVDYPPAARTTATTERARTAAADYDRASANDTGRGKADPSPHFDGRAQPGDVIGFETGGERTYLGETAEDENDRREAAEKADRKG